MGRKIFSLFFLICAVLITTLISKNIISVKKTGTEVSLVNVISPRQGIKSDYFSRQSPPEEFNRELSIDSIFSDDHSFTATISSERKRVLIATGDIIPARSVNFRVTNLNDFHWPFLKTAELLKSGDLTVINLESPLIDNCQITNEGMKFCGDSRNVAGLVFAGIDVANLANNHMGNYGVSGVENTKRLLNDSGIATTGTGEATIRDIRGFKFSFLGYNDIESPQPGISQSEEEKITKEIKTARGKADIIVVSFHWGIEYTPKPSDRQRRLAHLAVDSGADLILGNHPHQIQPTEIYKGKLIVYAHGNFVFDQMWSENTKKGVVGRYTFYDNKIIDAEFTPIYIEDYGQPRLLKGDEGKEVLTQMKSESLKLVPIE